MSTSQAKAAEPPLRQQLDQWLFGFGSTTTLGVFRILIGTLTTINLLMILTQWKIWFSESGFVPSWIGQFYFPNRLSFYSQQGIVPRIDVLGPITDSRISLAIYLLVIVAGVLTTLGLWTRISTILLAVGIVSIHHRNGLILHGGDTVVRICCLYLALAPCGAACSIDRIRRVAQGKEGAGPVERCLWVQRVMCYEVALVYFTTFWLKYWGSHWRDGTATFYTAHLPEFYRFAVPSFFREPPMTKITTYFTLFVEFSMGTIVFFRPMRRWILFLGISLHAYIDWSMNIPLFGFLMVSCYINFYDGEEISGFFERLGRRMKSWQWSIIVPEGCKLSEQASNLLHIADPFRLSTLRSEGTEVRAVDSNDKPISLRWALLRGNPGIAPLLATTAFRQVLAGAAVESGLPDVYVAEKTGNPKGRKHR